MAELSRSDPIVVSAHFLSPASSGPIDIEVNRLRKGRRHSSATASLRRGTTDVAHFLGTFGDLTATPGQSTTYLRAEPPRLPSPDECPRPRAGLALEPPAITRRVELRFLPEHVGFADGRPHGFAEVFGWARFADGRPPDSSSLPLFADAFPPAVFNAGLAIA